MSFEELGENLFCIKVPLPENPLRELNVYLLRRSAAKPGWRGRSLLIDNGFNRPECSTVLLAALKTLGVGLDSVDFFVTHRHSDHCGLTYDLLAAAGPEAWVFASKSDAIAINMFTRQTFRQKSQLRNMTPNGLPQEILKHMLEIHPGLHYAISGPCPFTPVMNGDAFDYAGYTLHVLEMPGHTPGLLCLYDKDKRILFSSDHILGDISPNITCWPGVRDPLGSYLRSLRKAQKLDVRLCLPGHRRIVADYQGRAAALQQHHAVRLDEARNILDRQGESDAYSVASRMTWSIRAKNWEDFPNAQKYFACGEARAHLEHLCALGQAKRVKRHEIFFYSLT